MQLHEEEQVMSNNILILQLLLHHFRVLAGDQQVLSPNKLLQVNQLHKGNRGLAVNKWPAANSVAVS